MIDKGLNYGRHHIRSFTKQLTQPQIIVDLGAGSGNDLLIAKENHPQATLIGVESYEPNIHKLQQKGIKAVSLNIERDKLPFEDESVDVVIANQILEHCKEIWWVAHEVSRVLKVGGSFIIGVPNLASFHNRMLLLFGRQPTCIQNDSAHVRGYTKRDLFRFMNSGQEGRYSLENFKGSNFYPFPPALAKPMSALFSSYSVGIFFHLKKTAPYNSSLVKFPREQQLETNFFLGE